LLIGGVGVARGYLNRPQLTEERFVPNPFVHEQDGVPGRLYRTGDLARYLASGHVEFMGRKDHQVKLRGMRLELGEIEGRLQEHAAVKEAVVLLRDDDPSNKRLVAYFTSSGAQAKSAQLIEALRTHIANSLPAYMLPAAIVHLSALPLSQNGKLDRAALPRPAVGDYAAARYEEPSGEVETKLARLWAEVLELERIGRHDTFFALGGHSLLAVRLLERMRRERLDVDVRALFAAPTVASLAATLEAMTEVTL
jgi:aryl carrier-like protein